MGDGGGHSRKGGRQEGQRDKVSRDAVTPETVACPQDSSGAMSRTKARSHCIPGHGTQAALAEGANLGKGPLLPPKARPRRLSSQTTAANTLTSWQDERLR